MACSPFVKALEPLKTAGLEVEVDGRYVLVTDDGLDFSRDHDGLAGIRQFIQDTLDEYEQACQELFEEDAANSAADEPQQERPVNFVKALLKSLGRDTAPVTDPPAREFAPSPPVKNHIPDNAQLDLARSLNGRPSNKELARALEIDDQDRGGIPDPVGFITQRKQEVAMSRQKVVVVLVKGQRFMAPEGYKIKEVQPGRTTPIFYGSIFKGRKLNNELAGSRFSLVRL